jgi:hypothetical protein
MSLRSFRTADATGVVGFFLRTLNDLYFGKDPALHPVLYRRPRNHLKLSGTELETQLKEYFPLGLLKIPVKTFEQKWLKLITDSEVIFLEFTKIERDALHQHMLASPELLGETFENKITQQDALAAYTAKLYMSAAEIQIKRFRVYINVCVTFYTILCKSIVTTA